MSPVVVTAGVRILSGIHQQSAYSFSLDSLLTLLKTPFLPMNYLNRSCRIGRLLKFLSAFMAMLAVSASAQNLFPIGIVVNTSTNILANSLVTYTIGVTNLTTIVPSNVFVTNAFPASVQIVSSTQTQGISTNRGSRMEFLLGAMGSGASAVMTVTVRPTATGFFTNVVTVFVPDVPLINSTNVVLRATNIVARGDIRVSIAGPTQPFYPGDLTTLGITISNLGPNTVTNITLTNTLPNGMKLLAVSPASQAFTLTSSNVTYPFTSLTNREFRNLSLRVQMPTNPGVSIFLASVGSTGNQDTNAANNSASTNVLITDYFPATLLAVTNSAQITNRLNGLIEQRILVSNTGASDVDSVRVIVSGLTNTPIVGHPDYLFNVWGTNSGNPFVVYAHTLTAGQSVELLLQFSVANRSAFPFDNSQLHAFGVRLPDLTPPPGASTSTNINFTRLLPMTTGDKFLEFKSTAGNVYTIVYADNILFSNALMAVPPIVAPANYVQWIDYGPPATVSKPGAGSRYYRVFLNP
jgi:uncharacterized repeat protein (TIGR01451 family)